MFVFLKIVINLTKYFIDLILKPKFMKIYFSRVNNSLYSTFFTLLFGCFSTFVFVQNPPNAYLIDHRGVPQLLDTP
jgi:ABC-type sulfate transport system permease component